MGLGKSGLGLKQVYPFKTHEFSCLAGLPAGSDRSTRQTRLISESGGSTRYTRLISGSGGSTRLTHFFFFLFFLHCCTQHTWQPQHLQQTSAPTAYPLQHTWLPQHLHSAHFFSVFFFFCTHITSHFSLNFFIPFFSPSLSLHSTPTPFFLLSLSLSSFHHFLHATPFFGIRVTYPFP
jgi:hypothetical protein